MAVQDSSNPGHGALRSVLASHNFRRLYSIRLAGQFGDGLLQSALATFVLFSPEREPDAVRVAAAFAILLLPYSFIGPFAGVLLDRWQRRNVLVRANLLKSLFTVPIIVVVGAGQADFVLGLFVLIVLGAIARLAGFSIIRFIAYIKDELLIVLGTSSSETVLPQMIQKMEHLGASRSVVGLVIPTGYSFNLDGTNIYMTLATLFLAQATNTHLTIWQELGILGIAMITSKGASGVTGAGFITLAATLSIVPDIPIQSIAILVGIDKFMSECRALTNLVGNGVACVVISLSEGELDKDALHETMAHPIQLGEALEPGATG